MRSRRELGNIVGGRCLTLGWLGLLALVSFGLSLFWRRRFGPPSARSVDGPPSLVAAILLTEAPAAPPKHDEPVPDRVEPNSSEPGPASYAL